MKVSYIYWQPWFGGATPRLDLKEAGRVTPGYSHIFASDAVVVHAPSLISSGQTEEIARLRRNTPSGQTWVLETHESSANYPGQSGDGFRLLFDAEMSHRQMADVWVPYFSVSQFADYAFVETGGREELCCAFISSRFNGSGRSEYVAELMRHMEIASYGSLLNNRRLDDDTGADSKHKVLRSFRYTLAFENSIETDYVTEKFFDPFMCGTVPIYLGAPNISEFAPGENCFIDASNFREPAELARYLRSVDYREFHAWRKKPLRPSFVSKLQRLSEPMEKRFAAAVLPLLGRRAERSR